MSTTLTVKRIRTLEDLEAIGPLWKEQQDACSFQHVLMDHRWVTTWWRHFGARAEQNTLVLSAGRTPVGIMPLSITLAMEAFPFRDPYLVSPDDYRFLPGLRWQRLVPVRRLAYPLSIVSGNIRGQVILPQPEQRYYTAFMDCVADMSGEWDVATLAGIRKWENEEMTLQTAAQAAGLFPSARRARSSMLYIDLPSTFADFLNMRSGDFRRELKRECNKLERTFSSLGPMKVTSFRGPEIAAGLNRLFALEQKSWKVADRKKRRLHLSLDDHARTFFHDVAARFSADDNAQILILSFGDTDAAGKFHLERAGFSSGILTYRNEHLSHPVSIAPLWKELISGYINRGLTRLEIAGYQSNYRKWAKEQHDYESMILFNTRPFSRVLSYLDKGSLALGRRPPENAGNLTTEPMGSPL